jgi:tRNA-splicing endonuclease subunit Sen2
MNKTQNKKKAAVDLVPLPLTVYPSDTYFNFVIKSLLQCYYSVIKPKPQFTGTFMEFGRFVWIQHGDSVRKLYHSGFFGKGDLSRSEPTWLSRNIQQNKDSLEEITFERRRKRRNQKLTENDNLLKPDEILNMTCYTDAENFQLDLYEAFFLAYALNSLSITSSSQVKNPFPSTFSLINIILLLRYNCHLKIAGQCLINVIIHSM